MNRREFQRLAASAVAGAAIALPTGCALNSGESSRRRELEGLAMQRFNTTLMGMLKGAFDYYGIALTPATLFGASGHAFLINIHETLCPSGPYCWNTAPFVERVGDLGLAIADLGYFGPDATPAERARIEGELRQALDVGAPCGLLNLENQLITGYDEQGFITAQPWAPEKTDYPPGRLTYGAWGELGEEFHLTFYRFDRATPAARADVIARALAYAQDLHANPARHSRPGYGVGPAAYDNWIAALPEAGAGHGNWWNATVWAECRRMASAWFEELRAEFPAAAAPAAPLFAPLVKAYAQIARQLRQVAGKDLPLTEKATLLADLKQREAKAIVLLAPLAEYLK